MITAQTKLNIVIGNPIGHSQSPAFHNAEYARRGYDAVMLAFESADVAALMQAVRNLKIGLTAVTLPHKETVMAHLDEVDALAARIGAVNTVIQKDGRLLGFNTDYAGIAALFKGIDVKGRRVMVLGAGGAARPLAAFLQDSGAAWFCFNRNVERAAELAKAFGGEAVENPVEADIVVNATPVGMHPNVDESPLEKTLFHTGQIVLDFIYNPEVTRFLQEAAEAGAEIRSGKVMFEAQALEQIRLWESLTKI